MTATMTPRADENEPQPYIGTNPFIEVNNEELHCLASSVALEPDVSTVDTPTFCGTKSFPGQVQWSLNMTLYQSFDDGGTDQILRAALQSRTVPYVIRPYRDEPVGPNNPEFTGYAITQPYTLLSMDAGEASTIDISWTLTAEPTVRTTATRSAEGSTATPEGSTSTTEPTSPSA